VTNEIGDKAGSKTLADWVEGLRWRFLATLRLWRRQTGVDVPEAVREAAAAVRDGRLDPPAGGGAVAPGAVKLHGWTLFSSGPVSKVELWLDERPLGRARLGLPRPDVCRALGLEPGEATGFELVTILEDGPGSPGEVSLRAVATGVDGERLELGPLSLLVTRAATPRLASPPERTPPAPRRPGLRTLVFTHQLDLGGAQLYLMDLLRELLRTGAVNPTVVSARDGRLREKLEGLGVPVHISASATESLGSHLGQVEELAAWAADRDFEVAFVNTATSLALPGVEVAGRLGIPAIWAIHESVEPVELWSHVDPAIAKRAVQALGEVDQALFVAEATQRLFEPATGPGRGITIPYGLDLDPIDSRRRDFDRAGARRRAGIPLDADVVLCVGALEPRKAQVPLAQAFDLVAVRHPRAQLAFVGGRDDLYSQFLSEYVARSAATERIAVVPMTPDVQSWFGLADLVVCASDVESMPRMVLEAMAWETPVLATSVFGLPELIDDGESGWLCEPRDLGALSAALDRALASGPEERRRLGRAGRSLVESRHSLEDYGHQVADLLDRVVAGPRVEQLMNAASR
jgi:D-inositol-3-phosphate glycosyltransferase